MRTSILAAVSMAACLAAHAQTYDLDITMTGIAAGPVTFSGSFAFNPTASGLCSAAFCGPGVTPRFVDVLISDPLSIDQPGGAFAFTNAVGGSSTVSFFDTYLGAPGQSSFAYQLNFTLDHPLGGPTASIGLSDVYFTTDGNATGTYSCGGPARIATPGITCTTATLTEERVATTGFATSDSPQGVPEPGTFSLLALALTGIGMAGLRRSETSSRAGQPKR